MTDTAQMQFSYDAEHQMTEAVVTKNDTTQRYQYTYDPFGRRISKTDAFNRTGFVWDGNRLLSETRGSRSKTYVYEQDGFVPVAQVIAHQGSEGTENENTPTTKAANDLLYYHTDHLGTPRELSDQEGHIVWAASYKAWGNTLQIDYPDLQQKAEMQAYPLPQEDIDRLDIKQLREKRADKAHALIEQWEDDYSQNLRFQGQYFDSETGLHYNRFRYYDPDVGRFVTQDPIGLLGGDNFYKYGLNSIIWSDPLGLDGYVSDHNSTNRGRGYIVYAICKKGNIQYVGQAGSATTATNRHRKSGRLSKTQTVKEITTVSTYGEVRGYEQALIEENDTMDGKWNCKCSRKNTGNKKAGFDRDSKTRETDRQAAFEKGYQDAKSWIKSNPQLINPC